MQICETYQEFINYLSAEKDISTSTKVNYSSDFDIFLKFLHQNGLKPELQTITTPIIRKYLSYLKITKSYSNNTMRRKIHSLSSFFKFLIEQEYIEKNPMLPVHAPKLEQKLPIYLKENEIKKLISMPFKHSRNNQLRDKCILETLAMTGIRRQELLGLDWQYIDFGTKTITVINGKGKKQRVIPITDPLVSDLWAYLQTRLPLTSNAVYLSGEGNRLSTTAIEQLFKRYISLAGLNGKGYTIHKLRHSYASLLVQNNVSILSVQQLLGHSDLNSTKIYSHVNTNFLREEVKKFPLSTE